MFFPLTIKNKKEERGGRSGHMTVKNKIWCFLSSYLAHPDINSQKLVIHAKPDAYYLQYVHDRVIWQFEETHRSDACYYLWSKHPLGFFTGSIITQKSQPENVLFPSVFSLPLLVKKTWNFHFWCFQLCYHYSNLFLCEDHLVAPDRIN